MTKTPGSCQPWEVKTEVQTGRSLSRSTTDDVENDLLEGVSVPGSGTGLKPVHRSLKPYKDVK